MRHLLLSVALIAGLLLPIGVAQAQGTGTVTATCKDGTSFTGAKRSGACRGHGGVQSWGTGPESSGLVNQAIEPASTPTSAKNAAQAQGTGTVTATCKDGTPFSGAKACRRLPGPWRRTIMGCGRGNNHSYECAGPAGDARARYKPAHHSGSRQ